MVLYYLISAKQQQKIAYSRILIVHSHINFKNRMSHADVAVAPSIEGQNQGMLGDFV